MASPDSRASRGIENLDRISQLPEPMILNILSRLPLEDCARASILSKTWKNFCSLYPILYLDHNLFALQSLVSGNEGGGEPDIDQIGDMFMDYVDYELSRVRQRGSPIRKLGLFLAVNESMHFPRVDKWMELVKQITVEDLCITMQAMHNRPRERGSSSIYKIPFSVLATKGLLSFSIRGCYLGCETLVGDLVNKIFSLERLSLSCHNITEPLLENLIRSCQGLEVLVFDNCVSGIKYLKLSKFPKLKKAVIDLEMVDYIDVVDTNLECLICSNVYCQIRINPDACGGIRELALDKCVIEQPSLLTDLTSTFPVLEEADFLVEDIDTLKAANNVLRKLKFYSSGPFSVKKLHVDCPSLTMLDFYTDGLSELYVDCPKLRMFRYSGPSVPDHVFWNSMVNLEESRVDIFMGCGYDYDTLWFVKLRAFLILVTGNATTVKLTLTSAMAKFEPEKFNAFQVSSQYNLHSELALGYAIQDKATATQDLVDGLLWVIRPTTLTVNCEASYIIKYLCENLSRKQEDINPCWMHQLEDFNVECPLDVPVTKKDLVGVPEQCRNLNWRKKVRFIFHWCRNS